MAAAYARDMGNGTRGGSGSRPGHGERGTGGLVGGGPSQLGVDGAMRARDVSRPDDTDLDEAERSVEISHRPQHHGRPPAQDAGNGGSSPDAS